MKVNIMSLSNTLNNEFSKWVTEVVKGASLPLHRVFVYSPTDLRYEEIGFNILFFDDVHGFSLVIQVFGEHSITGVPMYTDLETPQTTSAYIRNFLQTEQLRIQYATKYMLNYQYKQYMGPNWDQVVPQIREVERVMRWSDGTPLPFKGVYLCVEDFGWEIAPSMGGFIHIPSGRSVPVGPPQPVPYSNSESVYAELAVPVLLMLDEVFDSSYPEDADNRIRLINEVLRNWGNANASPIVPYDKNRTKAFRAALTKTKNRAKSTEG